MNIKPRSAWEEKLYPVKGPAMKLSTVTILPLHYTAAERLGDDTAQILRNIQRDYTISRHYSIGYNFAVDRTGQMWECRGWDIKCAANVNWNDKTIAILCLVDGAQPLNDAMIAAVKTLAAEAQRRTGRVLMVVGHRDIGSTACPGAGIYAQIKAGLLTPGNIPIPIPPQPLPPLENDMAIAIFESQTSPKEFNALFFAECDALGRSIELQWSGDGSDPRVQERVATMDANFGPRRPILLVGVKNNRLHPKHKPSDISDSLHQWTANDFAP